MSAIRLTPEGFTDWEHYRAQLRPCRCGEHPSRLRFRTAHMLGCAGVWCDGCGVGTPEEAEPRAPVYAYESDGPDALAAAVAKWNQWAQG